MVVDVRFAAHHGLKSDIAPSPGSAIFGLMHRSKDYLFDPPIGNGKARRNDQATQIKLTVLIRRSVTLRTRLQPIIGILGGNEPLLKRHLPVLSRP